MRNIVKVTLCATVTCFLANAAVAAKKDKVKQESKDMPAVGEQAAPKVEKAAVETLESQLAEFIVFDKTGKMAPVKFPHAIHGQKNGCKACHEGEKPLFTQKRSGVDMKMADMYAGKTCGSCHDGKKKDPNGKVIFAAKAGCMKCHKK
ncbi:MAG: c(7)-type cytochrome triheme domain-containing protein [Elusimicrobiota bacterium]